MRGPKCLAFLDWHRFRQQMSKLKKSRTPALRETEAASDVDEMYSDLRRQLQGRYSIDSPKKKKKFLGCCSWFAKKDREIVDHSRWQLLSKGLTGRDGQTHATFPISLANFDYYQKYGYSTSCKSFVTIYDLYVDNVLRVYQNPIACPTAPVQRLWINQPVGKIRSNPYCGPWSPICNQLRCGSSKIVFYWESYVESNRIDRMLIYDLDRKFSANYFSIKAPIKYKLYFCFADKTDDRLKLIYFNNRATESEALVFECAISDDDHFPEIRMIDKKTWNVSSENFRCGAYRVNFWKSFDDQYFVWFLNDSGWTEKKLQNLFCVTYERDVDDDNVWKWSPDLIPFSKWVAESKWGRRLMQGVAWLKEIRPRDTERDLARQIELKYDDGAVFANIGSSFLRRYAFRPPSLQSMAADHVRRMIERETEETQSLSKWNWWRKLVGAAGLFDLCPRDYGQQELNIDDV